MDIILIPGLWLDASSWSRVVPTLQQAGHRTHPLTLPGLESEDADRSAIGLRDHVAAVVAAIDAADGPVALVAHSAGCGVAYAAVDARPDRVAEVVYVGGFPTGAGSPIAGDFSVAGADLPFPEWSEFDEADLAGLDEPARAAFRERAIPAPARLTTDAQELTDERRYEVPATVVCTEFTTDTLKEWIAGGAAPVREFPRLRSLRFVDLPTGHWPQFTRPEALGRVILSGIATAPETVIDGEGRPEPPIAADEAGTLTGFLDYQRETLAWKCGGLDPAALRATTAASSMTLGGMLKHLTYVEDLWFSRCLLGRDPHPPWDTVDWEADVDWDWHSAADDSPDELFTRWRAAVARSHAAVAEALAGGGLDQPARRSWPDGRSPSLRWILVHVIEEYARHNGHADLLREAVDGVTGE